jgi:hypothetical protein
MIENFKQAIIMRVKTPDDIQAEMEEPTKSNFAIFEYNFPTGFKAGVGKSRRPSHASLFQLIVTDFNGMPNIKFPSEYAGEYTSTQRAEKALTSYCQESWLAAEKAGPKKEASATG